MIERRGKSNFGSAALLACVAGAVATACDVPVPTEPVDTVEEVMADRGPGAARVERAVVIPEGPPRAHRRGAAATDTVVPASRAAGTLEERQTAIREADFLAYGPIVSIDGVRVDRAVFIELPHEDIERLKVIKGPYVACLVYGEEAPGIIVVVTKGARNLSDREALLGEDRGFTEEELQRGREGCSGR